MIEIVKVKNPFDKSKCETERVVFVPGQVVTDYVPDHEVEYVLNGYFVEQPGCTFPMDGDQLIVLPHVGGGDFKQILATLATMYLMTYTGNIANGLWTGGQAGLTSYLAAGAVMAVGGRVINTVFPTQQPPSLTSPDNSSPTYSWDTPRPITGEGGVVGITYGECIPAPQVLESHVETVNGKQYLNILLCGGMGPVDSITDIRINGVPIEAYE